MLGLFGDVSGLEIGVILLLSVLVFGSRLPEVASRAYTQFRKFREGLDRFRRDTGIDQEMREIQRTVRDAAWRQDLKLNLEAPEQMTVDRSEPSMPSQDVPQRKLDGEGQGVYDIPNFDAEADRTKNVGMDSGEERPESDDPSDEPTAG